MYGQSISTFFKFTQDLYTYRFHHKLWALSVVEVRCRFRGVASMPRLSIGLPLWKAFSTMLAVELAIGAEAFGPATLSNKHACTNTVTTPDRNLKLI